MIIRQKYVFYALFGLFALAVISGSKFYGNVGSEIGKSSTNVFSVLFGWQWLYLAAASLILLAVALVRKDKRLLRVMVIVVVSLAVVLVPAQFIYANRLYITGDGGPAGPEMACLVWNNSKISGAYEHRFGWCTLMSMPSLNKFYIDRGTFSDTTDSSFTYYLVLVINEAILIGGLVLANKKYFSKHTAI